MNKLIVKAWLYPEDKQRLIHKAKRAGFEGRGSLGRFLQKLAREDVVFLDENVKRILKALELK